MEFTSRDVQENDIFRSKLQGFLSKFEAEDSEGVGLREKEPTANKGQFLNPEEHN